ncbi:MAG: methionyl-tRNA formyltransferase [Gammaproteobacteria bacterium]
MKILFAGTPEFAASILEALIQSNHQVIAVLCQPDKPSGRGQKNHPPATKILAGQHGIPVLQPTTLKSGEIQSTLRELKPDLMVVAVYGLLLPQAVLSIPRLGCLNVHASLLPRWRGASPIHQAILSGDPQTGITLMKMDVGLDTGDMLLKAPLKIQVNDTTATLFEKLSTLGASCLVDFLNDCDRKNLQTLVGEPQENSLATHASKITKQDACIDWDKSALQLEREIRAFQPWPISFSMLDNQVIRFWSATVENTKTTEPPGTILSATPKGLKIATGDRILCVESLQLPGKKPLPFNTLFNGHASLFAKGKQFVMQSGNL